MENRNTPRPESRPARLNQQPLRDADLSDDADDANDGTGELPNVENESNLQLGGDTGFDRVVGPEEAGLGGGLDQAEEARLGITDEELAEMAHRSRTSNK